MIHSVQPRRIGAVRRAVLRVASGLARRCQFGRFGVDRFDFGSSPAGLVRRTVR
jgi:hypothetical protein